jgi:hypothetical protein
MAARGLHDLINVELRVTPNVKAPDPELDGNLSPVDKSLVLCDVIRGSKMDANHVPHVNTKRQDEEQAHANSCFHERPIEVHRLELRLDLRRGELGVGPFRNEVRQHLGLDGLVGRVREGFSHELDRPFGDPSSGLSVLDDFTQRKE